MLEDGGYTKSYRRKWTNPAFRNLRDAGIWSWLIDTAAWKETMVRFQDHQVTLQAGQLITSERFIAEGFCCDRSVIRRLLVTLEERQMLTRQNAHGATIITICKYNEYQGLKNSERPAENPGQTQRTPSEHPNKKEAKEGSKEVSKEVSKEEIKESFDQILKALGGKRPNHSPQPNWDDPANRKARWQQKMQAELFNRLPKANAEIIWTGYLAGDPEAIEFIETVDKSIRQRKAQAA